MERIPTLKEHILRRLVGHRTEYLEFRALQSIHLEVLQGETLGIIGRNGAGKTTLLKVIARILYPTSGRVQITGRVLPLLELGAGFSAELTGRENIFLYGALLNIPNRVMQEKCDAVIAFSELGSLIDSPVRTYSSGMTLRLAFAIASSVQPDILIVDEVLAVGDFAFAEKCKARIAEFQREGCTTLFVSHTFSALRDVCSRAIWMDKGQIVCSGSVDAVIETYEAAIGGSGSSTSYAAMSAAAGVQ